MAPTIEEQIAWLRELHAFQMRQYGTLVETGRMSVLDADRKKRLGAACLASLETLKPNITHDLAGASRASALKTPAMFARFQCGEAYEDLATLNADLLRDPAILESFMKLIESKVRAVLATGLKRAEGA